MSSNIELRNLVPDKYESWRRLVLDFLEECALLSPIVAREYEVTAALIKR